MIKHKRIFLLLALAGVSMTGCRKSPDGPDPGDYYLPVLETTDIHGYLVNRVNGSLQYRMANVADKVNEIRGDGEAAKDRLLLLDGGDLYQGASISNLLDGWPISAAMDKMGYDAVALGNHEFDWGIEKTVDADATMPDYDWDGTRQVNKIPVLCANLFQNGVRAPFTQDYVIVTKTARNAGGKSIPVKIGVIGFAVDYGSSIMTSKFSDRGFSIQEEYEIADELAKELEASGKCDATVLLVHGAADEAVSNLRWNSSIDLVLGGHSHETMTGRRGTSGSFYMQGGKYCERFAVGNLIFTVDRKSGKTTFTGVDDMQILAVSATGNLDADILAVSNAAISATALQAESVIGHITVDASSSYIPGSGNRATPMSNWMCDILRRIGQADVSFVNSGGVRTSIPLDGQTRRDITVANIYEMFPFNNTTYVYQITYEDLLRLLEYAMTDRGQGLFSFMTGIDCYYRNGAVVSLVKDGATIYQNRKWVDDWASRSLLLSVSEFLATSARTDGQTGKTNPLLLWNRTPRLLSSDRVDNESAILVLKEEAAASGGHLFVDTEPHFILQ
ncbi:MAG: 5'-nucleotidase C-terminal domain-containing protein [Bacteroidales bacterium]|nr:5'-nucleotidase C-terminal domain-containing protein [Bacteroidales bacterium]